MNKAETAQLLLAICSAYPIVELTEERIAVWLEDMEEIPFDEAMELFKNYRRTNKFPPTISDFYTIALNIQKQQREEREEWLRLNGSDEPLPSLKVGKPGE